MDSALKFLQLGLGAAVHINERLRLLAASVFLNGCIAIRRQPRSCGVPQPAPVRLKNMAQDLEVARPLYARLASELCPFAIAARASQSKGGRLRIAPVL
jgi:hypothetical protein